MSLSLSWSWLYTARVRDSVTGKQIILGMQLPSPTSSLSSGAHSRLTGAILHRAASAIVHYCEERRAQVSAGAEQAEYRSRIALSSSYGSSSSASSSVLSGGVSNLSGSNSSNNTALMELLVEKAETIVPESPEDLIRQSILLDTVMVCALVSSSPLSTTRRQAVIDVLSASKGNRCHIESCAVLLASQGED